MKEHPIIFSGEMVKAILEDRKTMTRRIIKPQPDESKINIKNIPQGYLRCPYGIPGDRLWVRETWRLDDFRQKPLKTSDVIYKADFPNHPTELVKWKPSIHMYRWASRITLEITDIRVERIQDITSTDVKKEGFPPYADKFFDLWNSINGKDTWERNDFVWVIEFRRLK